MHLMDYVVKPNSFLKNNTLDFSTKTIKGFQKIANSELTELPKLVDLLGSTLQFSQSKSIRSIGTKKYGQNSKKIQ